MGATEVFTPTVDYLINSCAWAIVGWTAAYLRFGRRR